MKIRDTAQCKGSLSTGITENVNGCDALLPQPLLGKIT